LADLKKRTDVLPFQLRDNILTLEVVFQTTAMATKTVVFTRQPLGLTLGRELPVSVMQAGGHAAELGVEAGWIVESVQGMQVADHKLTLDEVAATIGNIAHQLPSDESGPGFPVVFRDEAGRPRSAVFEEKPLGLHLSRNFPLTVTGVSNVSAGMGIKEGWTVLSVAGQDVTQSNLSYDEASALLKRGVAALPTKAKPKLDVTFMPNSATREVHFTRRPVNVTLSHSLPVTVKEVSGHTSEGGVQPGWILQSISDKDITNLKLPEAMSVWNEAMSRLAIDAPPLPQKLEVPACLPDVSSSHCPQEASSPRSRHEAPSHGWELCGAWRPCRAILTLFWL